MQPGGIEDDQALGQAEAAARHVRLPMALKLGYSSGQLVELVVGSTLNLFALFYVTAVCGLPGALAGLALGAGLIVDAVMDPLIGSLSDGWRSRLGRRVPFMIVGVIPLIIFYNLTFALPANLSVIGLFAWLMLLSVSLRISMSIFALPYQALGAELSDNYAERASIAVWRWGIGIIGTLVVIALGFGVFFSGPNGISDRSAYTPLTLTMTLLIVAGALAAIRAGLATRNLQHQTAPATEAIHLRLRGEMAEIFRNRTFRILFVSSLVTNVAQGVNQALGLHIGMYFWRLNSEQMQMLGMAAVVGLALGAPLAGPIAARIEKRTILLIGLIGMALCQALPVTLRLLDLLPLSGTELSIFLALMGALNGVMFALSVIAFLAIVPDAADEHEHLFGARREGLFFAGWAFASKAATGAGLLIAGVVLQLAKFPANVSEQGLAATPIPEQTAAWLAIAGGPGASLLAIAGALLALFYRLDRKSHAKILAELTTRRTSASA